MVQVKQKSHIDVPLNTIDRELMRRYAANVGHGGTWVTDSESRGARHGGMARLGGGRLGWGRCLDPINSPTTRINLRGSG